MKIECSVAIPEGWKVDRLSGSPWVGDLHYLGRDGFCTCATGDRTKQPIGYHLILNYRRSGEKKNERYYLGCLLFRCLDRPICLDCLFNENSTTIEGKK
jgi:hypothetical protein